MINIEGFHYGFFLIPTFIGKEGICIWYKIEDVWVFLQNDTLMMCSKYGSPIEPNLRAEITTWLLSESR